MAAETQTGGPAQERGVPYLGRSVRIVGPVEPRDPAANPNEMAARGELGKAALASRRGPMHAEDARRQVFAIGASARDPRNSVWSIMQRAPEGSVNPVKTEVTDPEAMSRRIKEVAKYLGADLVGIARAHPALLYKAPYYISTQQKGSAEGADRPTTDLGGPEEVCRKLPFVVVIATGMDYERLQAHRHAIGDIEYRYTMQKRNTINFSLRSFIREMGYQTEHRMAQPQPTAIAAGLGELGRNGLVITEKFGARVHLSEPILTDLPLVPDKPIDIGVNEFCKLCKKCATTCPSNSLPHGEKVVFNGVEKYQMNFKTCYLLKANMTQHWETCLTCTTVCPYSKRDAWWHTIATWSLKRSPVPLRPLVVKPLKWMDDIIWGKAPRRRVQWMGYDSGIPPASKPCNIPGCTAHGEQAETAPKSKKNRGYYAPLRENTNRFVR